MVKAFLKIVSNLGPMVFLITVLYSSLAFAVTVNDGYDPNANGVINSIAVQVDGKAVIGGAFTTVGGVTRNSVARLNSDGSLDTSFNPDASGAVNSIAIQADGRIVIGGYFNAIGGVTRN
jgi:hypothetical protein